MYMWTCGQVEIWKRAHVDVCLYACYVRLVLTNTFCCFCASEVYKREPTNEHQARPRLLGKVGELRKGREAARAAGSSSRLTFASSRRATSLLSSGSCPRPTAAGHRSNHWAPPPTTHCMSPEPRLRPRGCHLLQLQSQWVLTFSPYTSTRTATRKWGTVWLGTPVNGRAEPQRFSPPIRLLSSLLTPPHFKYVMCQSFKTHISGQFLFRKKCTRGASAAKPQAAAEGKAIQVTSFAARIQGLPAEEPLARARRTATAAPTPAANPLSPPRPLHLLTTTAWLESFSLRGGEVEHR